MKTILFYFSATGNTYIAARRLAKNLGDTKCIPIKHDTPAVIPTGVERIGFMFPVYAWGMPVLVEDFVKELQLDKKVYLFAAVTCGSSIGNTIGQTDRLLRQKGYSLDAGFKIYMPGNCVTLYDMASPEKQREKCDRANEVIDQMVPVINNKQKTDFPKDLWLYKMVGSKLIYPMFARYARKADAHFNVTDACNGCGICEKVCPANNIKLDNGVPTWWHRCEQCLACIHWCPKQAIQYKKATKRRSRYHHPDVKLEEMFSK